MLSLSLIAFLFMATPGTNGNANYADADDESSRLPSVVESEVGSASGSNRFVVWTQQNTEDVLSDISFRRSTDNGATWQPVINISNNAGFSFSPQIAVSGSNVYVVWEDETPGNYEVLLRRSSDNGATWGSIVNLSKNPGTSTDPQIAASGSSVYVVWTQVAIDEGPSDILFRKSSDDGATWGSKTNLSSDGESSTPEVSTSDGNVYVVWIDVGVGNHDVFFKRSTDGGVTWKSKVNLSKSDNQSRDPEIAATGGEVYVTWMDKMSFSEVFLRRSTDEGATWKSKVNLSNAPDYSDEFPKMAVSGSNVYVVWFGSEEVFTGDSDIFLRRSTDKGATWKPVVQLSNTGNAQSLHVAGSGSNVYVAWKDRETSSSTNSDIFFRRSTDNGASWKSTVNLSNNDGESNYPLLAATGNNVYLVWDDSRETFFKRSTDSGATWKTAKNLSNNEGNSEQQQIGI
jgi:hypothetical protein